MINKTWKEQLCAVMGNLINKDGYKTIIVNGVEDHVHCFFGLKPSISLSDLMKNVKAKSLKWINEQQQQLTKERFEYAPFLRNSYCIFHLFNGIKSTVTISVEPMVL